MNNSMLKGKSSRDAAKKIDDIYLNATSSLLSRTKKFLLTRLIALTIFPVSALSDTIIGTFRSLAMKLRQYFAKDPAQKLMYQNKAAKLYEVATKSLLGLLAFPLGIVNPKLVSFYFIPKREKYGKILSGGHLFASRPEIQYPKTVEELQAIIVNADKNGKKITVMGSGRSQGQQFLPNSDQGVVISMQHLNSVQVDPNHKTVIAGAGATWGDIQLKTNPHCLAVKVMQASNVFSVGGSISTNIHGWHKAGTVAKTIKSLTIIDAKGNLKKLNPQDELFKYVVGGFNQFGVIVNAEIELANNENLIEKSISVKPNKYLDYFKTSVVQNENNRMHLYRLSLDPNNMLQEGVAVNYIATNKTKVQSSPGFHLEPVAGTRFQRVFLNLARRFQWVRKLFWWREQRNLLNNETKYTTNEIMQPPINAMFNNSLSESEWLQEFFVPGENLDNFLKQLGALLTKNNVNVLNATVRYVKQDDISKMGYANQGDRFAVVLCFNQSLNPKDIIETKKWVRKAIDLALANNGTYYLPYQPFASKEQFSKAYPTASDVWKKKLEVDPKQTFSSGFAQQYLAPSTVENNHYKNILKTKQNKELFGKFLDNILDRVDKEKLYPLLDDITSYCDTNKEIYRELQNRIGEVMPNPASSAYRIYRSLRNIKNDLSEQAAALMRSQAPQKINGMIEIGYPGRFVNSFKNKLNISGQVSVLNDKEEWSDVIQSGFPKPFDRFEALNDYAPLDKNKFKDNSVDLITCFIGLHHIPEGKIDGFLSSLNRTLRPGGTFLLVDHDVTNQNTKDLANLAHSVYNAVMGVSLKEEMTEIRNFRSLDEWKTLLAKQGFEVQASSKKMVRDGDPTENTMLRFVKKPAQKPALQSAEVQHAAKSLLFSHGVKKPQDQKVAIATVVQQPQPPRVRI